MRILLRDDPSSEVDLIETLRYQDFACSAPGRPKHLRYAFAGFTLDTVTRVLLDPAGRFVDLTSSEFDLLMAFVAKPGAPISRAALLKTLKGRAWDYFDRSIDALVSRLRKKIDAGSSGPRLIRSVRSVGYVFCASVDVRSGG